MQADRPAEEPAIGEGLIEGHGEAAEAVVAAAQSPAKNLRGSTRKSSIASLESAYKREAERRQRAENSKERRLHKAAVDAGAAKAPECSGLAPGKCKKGQCAWCYHTGVRTSSGFEIRASTECTACGTILCVDCMKPYHDWLAEKVQEAEYREMMTQQPAKRQKSSKTALFGAN
eukprot:SAG22_NODE_146_length_17566_cov_17.597847_14_plen_174_part_00